VGRNVLDIFALCYHIQLRQNGHGLQPDREGPEHTVGCEAFVEEEGEHHRGDVETPVGEGV
jgi:hypothetical protein